VIPTQFGDWREEQQNAVQIFNLKVQAYLDRIYSEIVERVYINAGGYRIMLSVAYGTDQRLLRHVPEGCYTGQGFVLHHKERSQLVTPFGTIPVGRLYVSKGPRVEPITWWTTIGDKAPKQWQGMLTRLGYMVTGKIPDGLVFRVSSIDKDKARAIRMQDQFVNELMLSISPEDRKRLSGRGHLQLQKENGV